MVPFLKVVNDTAVAVNQGANAKVLFAPIWKPGIWTSRNFRVAQNTGDDRRRTHDMNTANWIPDLFMRRVMKGALDVVLLASVPDLHDKFGN